MSWIWLIAAIACEIIATLGLRVSDGLRKRIWIAPVIGGYLIAFFFLALALDEGMAIGVAYGIWTATGIALVALLARAIWKDPLTMRMALGIATVSAGVVLVELGAH
ncbi:DMT family transporter [Haloglycomyces albus]|uniref:DMT family transporter n=1 Tax=Haloglycomyces albus TaxID=526067 RepID=UPI00046D696D|nr:SMR family transporter [Haloglycomyces albus]